jgi:hypothetical protein
VLILSDEIHCDLTDTQYEYIPFASVSEICAKNSITCIAPTKAFNIADVQTAAVLVPNEVFRHKMNKTLNTDEVAEPNAIAMEATVAAFTKGEGWLNELRFYIEENRKIAGKFIESQLSELYLVPAHAEEVYKLVRYGTPVKIYGGPFGPFYMGIRTLNPGDRGADVFEIQKRLKAHGYFNGYVDGIYGEAMKEAVHKFQKKNKMYVTNSIGYNFCKRLGIVLFD